jgi:hypothetical protein
MKWILIGIVLILGVIISILIGYSYTATVNGPITPLGRDCFVKFANPDFYPGHPHSQLLAKFADDRHSKTALVVHYGGSSNYRSYQEGDVYIIEMAFIDTQGNAANINYWDSLKVAIYGIPDGRYKFKSDGVVYETYDEAMAHVYSLAEAHGQQGPIPMVWHGSARNGNPMFIQGCGFPLFFDIMERTYGVIPAYIYTINGMIFPYFNDPYSHYELAHYIELQTLYQQGNLNYD